jgi:predicted MFS family arabinose efflux permease
LSAQHRTEHPAVLKITLVCLGILLLAQVLIGALSFSALERLIGDMHADRIENIARRLQDNIENGLHMGKPLAQFFGLDALLEDALAHSGEISGIAVTLPDGGRIVEQGERITEANDLYQTLLLPPAARMEEARLKTPGSLLWTTPEQMLFATLLKDADGQAQGVLLMRMERDAKMLDRLVSESLQILLLITLCAAAALAGVFKYLLSPSLLSGNSRWRFIAPMLALALAQGAYALHVVSVFQDAWLEVIEENVAGLCADLARNLDRVLGYGIDLEQLRDIEAPFSRLAKISPVISLIELVDRDGKVLNRANAQGALRVEDAATQDFEDFARHGQRLTVPLGSGLERPGAKGALVFHLDTEIIQSGVRSRGLDALTVVVISLVATIEMLLLSFLAMKRAPPDAHSEAAPPPENAADPGKLARPILFGFLFAWALPLGFLPIYARSLMGVQDALLPQNLSLALPVALEMACGLLATLAAGGMADRRGWQRPVLIGLAVFALGMSLCALADGLSFLVIARGVVGLGYGLTWMGLQGFVVTRSPEKTQGRGMSEMIAGIFAGHLSGAAVGAMLAAQSGPRPVFVLGALMTLLPLLGILTLMRPYMTANRPRPAPFAQPPLPCSAPACSSPTPAPGVSRPRATLRLLGAKGFGYLLFGSVIPFSILQVGLLSFALPLYLESVDVPASSVGRVLMAYGLCVVYIGPFVGRRIDRARVSKKDWVLCGSLLAGASFFGLYVGEGVLGALLAVVTLALASCCLSASQTPYMLALPGVQQYGAASATGLMRAADKFGQMAGPLIVGALFGLLNMRESLAITALACLAAALPFAFLAPRRVPGHPPGILPPHPTP